MDLTLITVWLVAAINAWAPFRAETSAAHRAAVAADVAAIAYDPAEPPLFAGPDGRAKTALLIASVTFFESQYREDIDAGRCRKDECDRGRAFCMLQVQPGPGGLVLVGDEWDYADRVPGARALRGEDLVADRQLCVRAALHMMRASMRHVHSLGEYTGEGRDGPRARWRLTYAKRWLERNPAPRVEAVVGSL